MLLVLFNSTFFLDIFNYTLFSMQYFLTCHMVILFGLKVHSLEKYTYSEYTSQLRFLPQPLSCLWSVLLVVQSSTTKSVQGWEREMFTRRNVCLCSWKEKDREKFYNNGKQVYEK